MVLPITSFDFIIFIFFSHIFPFLVITAAAHLLAVARAAAVLVAAEADEEWTRCVATRDGFFFSFLSLFHCSYFVSFIFILFLFLFVFSCAKKQENPDPSRVIGVFGLSVYTSERTLRDEFSRFGTIDKLTIVYDRNVRFPKKKKNESDLCDSKFAAKFYFQQRLNSVFFFHFSIPLTRQIALADLGLFTTSTLKMLRKLGWVTFFKNILELIYLEKSCNTFTWAVVRRKSINIQENARCSQNMQDLFLQHINININLNINLLLFNALINAQVKRRRRRRREKLAQHLPFFFLVLKTKQRSIWRSFKVWNCMLHCIYFVVLPLFPQKLKCHFACKYFLHTCRNAWMELISMDVRSALISRPLSARIRPHRGFTRGCPFIAAARRRRDVSCFFKVFFFFEESYFFFFFF